MITHPEKVLFPEDGITKGELAAAYTVRARPGAPGSAPCTWEEIEAGAVHPQSFTLRSMAARVAHVGDLWAGLLAARSDRLH